MNDTVIINSTIIGSLNQISQVLGPDSSIFITDLVEGSELGSEQLQELKNRMEKRFSQLVNSPNNYLENCYEAFLLYHYSQSLEPLGCLCDKCRDILFESKNTLVPSYLLYRDPDKALSYIDTKTLGTIQSNLIGKSHKNYTQGDIYRNKIRALDYMQIYAIIGNQIEELDVVTYGELYYESIVPTIQKPLELLQYWKGRENITKKDYLFRKAIISFWIGGYFQVYEILRKHCIKRDDFTAREAYYYLYALSTICKTGTLNFLEDEVMPNINEYFLETGNKRKTNDDRDCDYSLAPSTSTQLSIGAIKAINDGSLWKALKAIDEESKSVRHMFITQERERIISILSSRALSEEDCFYLALIQVSESTSEKNCRLAQNTLSSMTSFPYSNILHKLLDIKINKENVSESLIEELLSINLSERTTLENVYETITPVIVRNEILNALQIPYELNLWDYTTLSADDNKQMQSTIFEDYLDNSVFSKIDAERNNERIKSFEIVTRRENRLNLSFSRNEDYSERREHIADNISKSKESIKQLAIHRNAVEDCLAVSISNYKLREVNPYLLLIYFYYLRGEINTRIAYSLSLYLLQIARTDLDYQVQNKQVETFFNSFPNVLGLKGLSSVVMTLINPFTDMKDLVALLFNVGNKVHYYIPPKGDQLKQYDEFKRTVQSAVIEHNGIAQTFREITTYDFNTKMIQLDAYLDSLEGDVIPEIYDLDFLNPSSQPILPLWRKRILIILLIILSLITVYNILLKMNII